MNDPNLDLLAIDIVEKIFLDNGNDPCGFLCDSFLGIKIPAKKSC